jgi:hypothetical protein
MKFNEILKVKLYTSVELCKYRPFLCRTFSHPMRIKASTVNWPYGQVQKYPARLSMLSDWTVCKSEALESWKSRAEDLLVSIRKEKRKPPFPGRTRHHCRHPRGGSVLSLPGGFLPREWARGGPAFSKPNPRAPCRACRVDSERSSTALKFFTLSSSKKEQGTCKTNYQTIKLM